MKQIATTLSVLMIMSAMQLRGDDVNATKSIEVAVPTVSSVAIASISDAFANGKVKGLLRYGAQHRNSNYHVLQDAPSNTVSNKLQAYSAVGGYLGYETATFYNISLGATIYTSNPLGSNPDEEKGLGGLYETDGGQDAYTALGEAFVKYQDDKQLIKIGRQEMPNYRFVSLSNIRMTPFTHEGAIYENSMIEGLKLNLAYITGLKDRNGVVFNDMVRSARVKTGCGAVDAHGACIESGHKILIRGDFDPNNFDSGGNYSGADKAMPMIGAIYGKDSFKVEAWDYLVTDFVNTVYLYGQYNMDISNIWKLSLAGQYVNQKDVGDNVAGNIDTWLYGLKVTSKSTNGMLFFIGYNEVSYNEASYDGGTLFVRWGTPQMFNSFQIQDSELAGTKSIGVGAQFDLGALGILDSTVIRFRYADYDMPDDLDMVDARQDRTEATFDLRYSFTKSSGFGIFTQMKGLSIQFRLAYDDFKTDYDLEAYKKLHGYDVFSVTDDFVDARIYIDYIF